MAERLLPHTLLIWLSLARKSIPFGMSEPKPDAPPRRRKPAEFIEGPEAATNFAQGLRTILHGQESKPATVEPEPFKALPKGQKA